MNLLRGRLPAQAGLMAPRSLRDRGPGALMPYLYILKSLKDQKLYVGTCIDMEKRLGRHNKGLVKSTKYRKPLILAYNEYFETLSQARKREWKLKYTPWGGKLKKELLSKTAGSSNGRTPASGAGNPGSNPGPAVLESKMA